MHCLLLAYNSDSNQPQLISKGYLVDSNCVRREPPYRALLTHNSKAIVLMLYENALKVIPL